MDTELLNTYLSAAAKVRSAVAGLTPAQLNAHPVPGTWSIQEIVIHLMDADLIWTDRSKRVIAEEKPSLIGYDETKFVAGLHYELWSIDEAITIFELNRKNFAKVLRVLPDSAFARQGTHNEAGVLQLSAMLSVIVNHVDHHLKFVHQKRAMVEKK